MRLYWTQERIVGALQLWAQENGRPPRTIDFDTDDHRFPYPSCVQKHCGTWNEALAMAGFTPRERGPGQNGGWKG